MGKLKQLPFQIALVFALMLTLSKAQSNETYAPSFCQKVMTYLNPRFIKEINGNLKLAFKVPQLRAFDLISQTDSNFQNGNTSLYLSQGAYDIVFKEDTLVRNISMGVLRYPLFFKTFGFFSDYIKGKNIFYAPGTKNQNKILDSKIGTVLEKPYRFKDWFPIDKKAPHDQKYGADIFMENIRHGKILLATDTYIFEHDRLHDHMIGILVMPKEVFLSFQNNAKLIFGLKTILSTDLNFYKFYQNMISIFMAEWDSATASVGRDINSGHFNINALERLANLKINPRLDDHAQNNNYENTVNGRILNVLWALEESDVHLTNDQKFQISQMVAKTFYPAPSPDQIKNAVISQFEQLGSEIPTEK